MPRHKIEHGSKSVRMISSLQDRTAIQIEASGRKGREGKEDGGGSEGWGGQRPGSILRRLSK